jgi:hypothetical protein
MLRIIVGYVAHHRRLFRASSSAFLRVIVASSSPPSGRSGAPLWPIGHGRPASARARPERDCPAPQTRLASMPTLVPRLENPG